MPSTSNDEPDAHGLPPPARARVVGAYAAAALGAVADAGVGSQALAQAIGWPGGAAPAPDEDWPVAAYLRLLAQGARLAGDPAFGLHVGQRMRLTTFATYGHVLLSCRTLGDAVLQTQRFEALAHDLGRSELVVEGGVGRYRWHSPWTAAPGQRHLAESVTAGIVTFGAWLARRPLPVHGVAFVHGPPDVDLQAEYRRLYGAPVSFGAPVTEARFDAALLDWPIPDADASLFPLLERHARQRLAERERAAAEPSLLAEVRAVLVRRLAHDRARLADVAAALALTSRSLQRRLGQAGTSFQQLLDATRRELALHYLTDPALTLTEVAFLLGFREASSLSHAFRAWQGCSPQQWRERGAGAAGADPEPGRLLE